MEYLDVVDEQGKPTGEVMEKEKVHDLNLLHWEVAIFVMNDEGQILLQKRAATKRFDPNKWGLCAGHVDSGESLEMAALRELNEEIGLRAEPGDLKILEEMDVRKRETNSHITRWYYIVTDQKEFAIQEEELSEVKWMDFAELMKRVREGDDSLVLGMRHMAVLEKIKL